MLTLLFNSLNLNMQFNNQFNQIIGYIQHKWHFKHQFVQGNLLQC